MRVSCGCVALAVAALWAGACGESAPPRPRGLLGPDGEPVAEAPPPSNAAPASTPAPKRASANDWWQGPRATRRHPDDRAEGVVPQPAADTAPGTDPPSGGGDDPLKRASRRLQKLIGQPRECLELERVADQLGGKVEIEASAVVMPSGRITRARASVSGHPAAAGDCVAKRLLDASLGPVNGTPTTVTAKVQVVVARTKTPKAAPSGSNGT